METESGRPGSFKTRNGPESSVEEQANPNNEFLGSRW